MAPKKIYIIEDIILSLVAFGIFSQSFFNIPGWEKPVFLIAFFLMIIVMLGIRYIEFVIRILFSVCLTVVIVLITPLSKLFIEKPAIAILITCAAFLLTLLLNDIDLRALFSKKNVKIHMDREEEFLFRESAKVKRSNNYGTSNTAKTDYSQYYEENYTRNSDVHKVQHNSGIDADYFAGCVDKDSVTKRYHQLMKIYHPDNQNGDTDMSQKLQEAYKEELKKY